MDDEWLLTVEALAGAGADAIEIGIPFSDPMIDGATIQEASLRALDGAPRPTASWPISVGSMSGSLWW